MISKSLLLKNNGQTACLANDVGETEYIHIKQQNLIILSSLAHKSIQIGQRSHCRPKTLQVQEERVRNVLWDKNSRRNLLTGTLAAQKIIPTAHRWDFKRLGNVYAAEKADERVLYKSFL